MIRVANGQVWVHDQDEALEFWTKKVGWEVRSDITMEELGGFRWLSVGAPGQDFSLALMAIPGPPVMAEQPYGLDSEFRDPSGNKYRLGKPTVT